MEILAVAGHHQTCGFVGRLHQQLAALFLAFGAALAQTHPVAAAEPVSKEYQIEAVFLWRFAQFVQWPTNAFPHPDSPLVIGVLGDNPFGDALHLAVKGETAHGRPIQVKYFRRIEEVDGCHELYVGRSETPRVKRIVSALAGRPILTVSAIDGFAGEDGGMVRFISERGRVSLRINVEATKAAGLVLDARLLRLAEVAGKP